MTRTGSEAIDWAKNQSQNGGAIWHNMCLSFVRQSFDVGSLYRSATDAWEGAAHPHRESHGSACPRGVPVYWTGGSQGYGHIVLSVGGGLCYSTDIHRYGRPDLVKIDDITRAWGQTFRGWTEDINGVHVYQNVDEWAKGTVYVKYLVKGVKDSDSVRRLQHRLLKHSKVPARTVKINGHYDDGTTAAVMHWQREVFDAKDSSNRDGTEMNNLQASRLFGDNYKVVEE